MPKLQTVGEVCTFPRWQRKFRIPSSAAFGRIGEEYVKAIYRFAEDHHIAVVHFKKGQNKEEVARPYLEAARVLAPGLSALDPCLPEDVAARIGAVSRKS